MPKTKRTQEEFYLGIAKDFPTDITTDKKILFCKVCKTRVNATKRSQVTQHLGTKDHLREKEKSLRERSSHSQQLITNMVVQSNDSNSNEPQYAQNPFNMELSEALVSGLYKIGCELDVCVPKFTILHTLICS